MLSNKELNKHYIFIYIWKSRSKKKKKKPGQAVHKYMKLLLLH